MKKITYFLEDRRHEEFVKALVERLAEEQGVRVKHEVLSNRGGAARVMEQLKGFARDIKNSPPTGDVLCDVLVVAIDANCKGRNARVREIRNALQSTGMVPLLVCCVPDPHIERWYVCDSAALRDVGAHPINPAELKCDKNKYKNLLGRATEDLLGGIDIGAEIAWEMRDAAMRAEDSLNSFCEEMRQMLKR